MAQEPVYSITGARASLSDEQTHRKRAYVVAMSIRVACFLAAVLVPAPIQVRGAFAFAAVMLPYFAVIIANSHRDRIIATAQASQGGNYTTDKNALGPRPGA